MDRRFKFRWKLYFLIRITYSEYFFPQETVHFVPLTHEKRMALTKEKNNTHKQRKLMSVQSKHHQMGIKRIFDGYQMNAKNGVHFSCVGLCDTRLKGSLRRSMGKLYFANVPFQ